MLKVNFNVFSPSTRNWLYNVSLRTEEQIGTLFRMNDEPLLHFSLTVSNNKEQINERN